MLAGGLFSLSLGDAVFVQPDASCTNVFESRLVVFGTRVSGAAIEGPS